MGTFENKVSGTEETSIRGISEQWTGVWGESHGAASGVYGSSQTGYGVFGQSQSSAAVKGQSATGRGVEGWSASNSGLWGISDSGFGVEGFSKTGDGVVGTGRRGVVGISETFQGVYGKSGDNSGVVGESDRMHAVFAITHSPTSAGLFATNTQGGNAGLFEGDVTVTGDLILTGADIAEQFDVAIERDEIALGSVVVLDDQGTLTTTDRAYDTRVAGIVSGAGDRVPALVLDRHARREGAAGRARRLPIAVTGKAWCFADATGAAIEVGSLLTTAPRTGHAMRVTDRVGAIGAVIGKALTPLCEGTGLVLVLVGLG